MRRAFVTGATGGLGRSLVTSLLMQGYEVTATGRNVQVGQGLTRLGARFIGIDLTQSDLPIDLEKHQVVFHLAALSSPWGSRDAFEAINVMVTRRLLDAAESAGCEAFVFASTPSIFATPRDQIEIAHVAPPTRPFANLYAETKYRAEAMVLAANRSGFLTTALRPRAIVGPHDTVLLPRLVRAASSGVMPLPRHGKALLELTDVRDAACAFVAADRHIAVTAGRAFNVSGGQPRTLRYLLDQVFAAAGMPVHYRAIPPRPAMLAASVMEAIAHILPGRPEPPATRYSIMSLAYSQTFDLTETIAALQWSPRYSPEQAIASAFPKANE